MDGSYLGIKDVALSIPWVIGKDGPEILARSLSTKHVLLPSADGRPLPSIEMAPYVEDELPLEHELVPWQIACYALQDVIATLNEIQFVALHAAEDFQLGHDLLFWQEHAQAIKAVIARTPYARPTVSC